VTQTPGAIEVVLYTRKGCHLCEEAKEQIRQVRADIPFAYRELDIDLDPELRQLYNDEVPVLAINGERTFSGAVNPRELRRQLRRAR
jgi:glutaredoxin